MHQIYERKLRIFATIFMLAYIFSVSITIISDKKMKLLFS